MAENEKNALYCSSGAMVGRVNGYDYESAARELGALQESGLIDGAELMMLKAYYDKLKSVKAAFVSAGSTMPIIHCEKGVGELLSDGAAMRARGENGDFVTAEAVTNFKLNCEMGAMIGASKMVLHLWGGLTSDSAIDGNAEMLGKLLDIATSYKIKLLIENVPCTTHDPLENWRKLQGFLPDIGFIFDSRFGAFHNNTARIFSDRAVASHIEHIHISDFVGFGGTHERDFSRLRPILHPCEGIVDFNALSGYLRDIDFSGTFTVESPIMSENGLDTEKMRRTLRETRKIFNI